VEITLSCHGNEHHLRLAKDDELTGILNEGIFASSKILPSDLFQEENKHVSGFAFKEFVDGSIVFSFKTFINGMIFFCVCAIYRR